LVSNADTSDDCTERKELFDMKATGEDNDVTSEDVTCGGVTETGEVNDVRGEDMTVTGEVNDVTSEDVTGKDMAVTGEVNDVTGAEVAANDEVTDIAGFNIPVFHDVLYIPSKIVVLYKRHEQICLLRLNTVQSCWCKHFR